MKQMIFYFLGCILFLLGSCSRIQKTTSTQNPMDLSTLTNQKWKLIEIAGQPVAATINGKIPYMVFDKENNRYSGTAGCNALSGNFSLAKNQKITFAQGISTLMACTDMSAETGLNKALGAADHYTIQGNTLSLNKARMAPLARFERMTNDSSNPALNGTWEVNYISGPRIAFEGLYPNKKPTIRFNLPETKASGNGSCNNYTLQFTINGTNIQFGEPASTRMACPGNGEATFFETLKKVTKYAVDGHTLHLIMDDIAVMRLEKK